jgi:hypothetical protein
LTNLVIKFDEVEMSNDHKSQADDDSSFSFAVRELRQATAAPSLALDSPKKVSYKELGSDPYNSSGSFDRKQNWTRIRKR